METWQSPMERNRENHIRNMLETIDSLESGSRLITLNMAVKAAQAQIAGHDITVALDRNNQRRQ